MMGIERGKASRSHCSQQAVGLHGSHVSSVFVSRCVAFWQCCSGPHHGLCCQTSPHRDPMLLTRGGAFHSNVCGRGTLFRTRSEFQVWWCDTSFSWCCSCMIYVFKNMKEKCLGRGGGMFCSIQNTYLAITTIFHLFHRSSWRSIRSMQVQVLGDQPQLKMFSLSRARIKRTGIKQGRGLLKTSKTLNHKGNHIRLHLGLEGLQTEVSKPTPR